MLEEDENGKLYPGHTAVFIMAVSLAVLAHDASARADDVLMGIAAFLLAGFTWGHSKSWETVKFRQGSISVHHQPVRVKVKSLST